MSSTSLTPLAALIGDDQQLLDTFMRALMTADGVGLGAAKELRYLLLPRSHEFPAKKHGPQGAGWAAPGGNGVRDGHCRDGIVKVTWVQKHSREIPAVVILLARFDVGLSNQEWQAVESPLVKDINRFQASLAMKHTKVMLVLFKVGTSNLINKSQSQEVLDERVFTVRRQCEMDSRLVTVLTASDLTPLNTSTRRLVKHAKELAATHYSAAVSRLQSVEKLTSAYPVRQQHLPHRARLFFKLANMHEFLGQVEGARAAYLEIWSILEDMIASFARDADANGAGEEEVCPAIDDSLSFDLEGGIGMNGEGGTVEENGVTPSSRLPAHLLEQVKGLAEVVTMRLASIHLESSKNVPAAIAQFRKMVALLSTPAAAGDLKYAHEACMSRQYLLFAKLLSEYGARNPSLADDIAYSDPGYYYLCAALHSVARRKSATRRLRGVDLAALEQKVNALVVKPAEYIGQTWSISGVMPVATTLRDCLLKVNDLDEAKRQHSGLTIPQLHKALMLCPSPNNSRTRKRCLIQSCLAEEYHACGQWKEAHELLVKGGVIDAYCEGGWMQMCSVLRQQALDCAWHLGYIEQAATLSLQLAGRNMWPWVDELARRALVSDALTVAAVSGQRHQQEETSKGEGLPVAASVKVQRGQLDVAVSPGLCFDVKLDHDCQLMRVIPRFSKASAGVNESLRLTLFLASYFPSSLHFDSLSLVLRVLKGGSETGGEEEEVECMEPAAFIVYDRASRGTKYSNSSSGGGGQEPAQLCSVAEMHDGAEMYGDLLLHPTQRQLAKLVIPFKVPASCLEGQMVEVQAIKLVLQEGLTPGNGAAVGGGGQSGGGGKCVFTVPCVADADTRRTVEAEHLRWREEGSCCVKVTQPLPGTKLTIGEGLPALVGDLTRVHVKVTSHPVSLQGAEVRIECAPPPTDASHAFFWTCRGRDGGAHSLVPMATGSDLQPLPVPLPLPLLPATPGAGSGSGDNDNDDAFTEHVIPLWVMPQHQGNKAISVSVVQTAQSPATQRTQTIAQAGHVLICYSPLQVDIAVAKAVPTEKVGKTEEQPDEYVVLQDDAVPVIVSVTCRHEAGVKLLGLELVQDDSSSKVGAYPHQEDEAADSADSGAVELQNSSDLLVAGETSMAQGDVVSTAFDVSGTRPGRCSLGSIKVLWERLDQDTQDAQGQPSGGNMGDRLPAHSVIPLPRLLVQVSPLSAALEAPSFTKLGEELRLVWKIQNNTHLYQDLQLEADEGSDFVWSGRRESQLQLGPYESSSVHFYLIPIVTGRAFLPRFSVLSMRSMTEIVTKGPTTMFVEP